jgi:glutamyl endopeptidase
MDELDALDAYDDLDFASDLGDDDFESDDFALSDLADDEGFESDFLEDEGPDYSVIGPTDDRVLVRAAPRFPSTLQFPYNTICFIETATSTGFSHRGTGTLIAPRVVLTAKHVLMNVTPPCSLSSGSVTGPLIPRLRITPGADLSAGTAGRQRPASPSSIIAGSAGFHVDPNLDYGIIILPRAFTRPTRFMMLQPRGDLNTATLLTIAGYPCDKPVGTMWRHSDRIPLTGVSATNLRYTIDTCPGHSGSPIWLLGNDGIRLLLGVHTTGAGGPNSRCPNVGTACSATGAPVGMATGTNCGVRITCRVIRFIQRTCRAAGVRGPVVDQVAFANACP